MELRQRELDQATSTLLSGESLLVLEEPGSGKTTLAERIAGRMEGEGFAVAIAAYGGSAKETLVAIAEALDVPIVTDGEKPKQLTAEQLRKNIGTRLEEPKTVLICDNAHRWSASLRYWLEDCHKAGALLLLLAYNPQPKDIFVKLPKMELPPLRDEQIRELMQTEAQANAARFTPRELAELQQRAGNNPAIAKRLVRESALGISDSGEASQHYQYVDGTPFLVAMLMLMSVIRFVGLGLGDKALYVLGGIFTIAALILRAVLYAANRGKRKL